MENLDFMKKRLRKVRNLVVLSVLFASVMPNLSFAQYYKSKQSGNWSDASTWSFQASQPFGAWVDATNPPGIDAANVIITGGYTVTLTADVSVPQLMTIGGASSFEKGTIDLKTYRLTCNFPPTILYPSEILSTIASATSYGNIYSTASGDLDLSEILVTITKDAGFTPSGNGTLQIIYLPNGGITYTTAAPMVLLPDGSEWSSNLSGTTLSVSYSFTTNLAKTQTALSAYASNGKLIYSGGEVYNVSGIKVASATSATVIALKSGIYFVKSGNRTQKVVVK